MLRFGYITSYVLMTLQEVFISQKSRTLSGFDKQLILVVIDILHKNQKDKIKQNVFGFSILKKVSFPYLFLLMARLIILNYNIILK